MRLHVDVVERVALSLRPPDRAAWYVACGLRGHVEALRRHIESTLDSMVSDHAAIVDERDDRNSLAEALGYNVLLDDETCVTVFTRYDAVAGLSSVAVNHLDGLYTAWVRFVSWRAELPSSKKQITFEKATVRFDRGFPPEFALVVMRAQRRMEIYEC